LRKPFYNNTALVVVEWLEEVKESIALVAQQPMPIPSFELLSLV
jgi:hypothetical protein